MFETAVIHQSHAAGRRFSLLTISLIAHSAVVVGAIAVSIATVDFPKFAPKEFAQAPVFLPMVVPPPLGDPNGGAARRPEPPRPAAAPPQQQQVNQNTAPSLIPETTTPVQPEAVASNASEGGGHTGEPIPGATSTAPFGTPAGVKGSVGEVVEVPATPVENKIYEAHEVKAPVGIYRPAPPYPALMIKTKMPATVVVRCVIDKNGRVRDPQITVPARMAPFNDAVLNAVQQWRFTPGSLNGQAVETYLSLTVHFSVN